MSFLSVIFWLQSACLESKDYNHGWCTIKRGKEPENLCKTDVLTALPEGTRLHLCTKSNILISTLFFSNVIKIRQN